MAAFLTGLLQLQSVVQPGSALASACGFHLGFAALHERLPAIVGSCLGQELHSATSGDATQQTTGGVLIWRKSDNWTAFTDGYQTWVSGTDAPAIDPRVRWAFPTARPADWIPAVFLGDSLSLGYFATSDAMSFRARLQAVLGVGGSSAREPIRAANGVKVESVSPPTHMLGASLVVVELGTNDYGPGGDPTPPAVFASRYQSLITRIRLAAPHAQVVCLGIWQPASGSGSTNVLGFHIGSYDSAIAWSCGGGYVDISSLYLTLPYHGPPGRITYRGMSDWFHPNDLGHQAIATSIYAHLLLMRHATGPSSAGT